MLHSRTCQLPKSVFHINYPSKKGECVCILGKCLLDQSKLKIKESSWIQTEINMNSHLCTDMKNTKVKVTSSSKHKLELTLSDDQRGEEEEVAHQLGSELVKESAGHSTVQRSAAVPHNIHQSDCQ